MMKKGQIIKKVPKNKNFVKKHLSNKKRAKTGCPES